MLLELNDEFAVQRGRSMTLETIAPLSDIPPRRAASRGDLTNPAQTGEGGDQAKLATQRWRTRPSRIRYNAVVVRVSSIRVATLVGDEVGDSQKIAI